MLEAGLTLIPFVSGEIAKMPLKIGKVTSSKVVNEASTAVTTATAVIIMAKPEG